ncbi:MAG: hypothetical protein EOO43_24865 [Flavobacterium sp.]|nr:MAG: hypothetical protein EOO43_24865 [Flavobacterium sp.]
MRIPTSPTTDASRKQLAQLTLIRSILLFVLWISFIFAVEVEQIEVSSDNLLKILIIFSSIHVLTFLRLKNSLPITELEFFIQLLLDVTCLSILFYFSGGANNPFISYLLIPIFISATTLPWRYTWLITITCLICYALLLFFYVHLPIFEAPHHHDESRPNWHIIGMWFNFSLSAILITYFIVKMARTLQEQSKILSSKQYIHKFRLFGPG